MTMPSHAPPELLEVCEAWARGLRTRSGDAERRAFVREELPRLAARRGLFLDILRGIAGGAPYPDLHRPTLFPNEIVLFTHEHRLFSLRMLLAEPGCSTPVHDHGAWGVITPFAGTLEVVHYEKQNPAGEAFAGLRRTARRTLYPGGTEEVLPLDRGIHRTGNPGRDTLVMLSVYGRPVRRPYVLGYDLEKQQVYRIHTPRSRKRLLAREVLEATGAP